MKRSLIAFLFAGLLAAPAAHANFVVEGNDVIDTDTGLAWLMPTETVGLSYNDVLAGAGGWTSAGWIYATGAQWKALMTRYVGVPNLTSDDLSSNGGYYAASGAYTATALSIVNAFGATYSFNIAGATFVAHDPDLLQIGSQGYLAGASSAAPGFGEVTAVLAEANPGQNGLTTDSPYGRWFESDNFPALPGNALGSFLVRSATSQELVAAYDATTVPEPASMAVVMAGLVGLIGVKRRPRWSV